MSIHRPFSRRNRRALIEPLEPRQLLSTTLEPTLPDQPLSSLSGYVYDDAIPNNQRDPSEPGVPDVTITLIGSDDLGNDVLLTTTTAPDGSYTFPNLRPGLYQLEQTQPDAYVDGGESVGTVGGWAFDDQFIFISLQPDTHATDYNFAESPLPSSLSGHAFHDANHDGARSPDEPALPGVTITLTGHDGLNAVSLSTTTDATGFYAFPNLRPGTYTLTQSPAPGYLPSTSPAPSIPLLANTDSADHDFASLLPSSLAGTVYADANQNGTFDPADVGIASVTLHLHDDAGTLIATTTTDASGAYTFSNLYPGTYSITQLQPADHTDGPDTPGTLGGTATSTDTLSAIPLLQGQSGTAYNFADTPVPTTPPTAPASWQSKDFQQLIRIVGATPTSLGNWLANTFPNLYGPSAGANNFTNKTGPYIADRYTALRKGTKLDSQILGLALSIFSSTSTLNTTPDGQSLAASLGLSPTPPTSPSNLANLPVNLSTAGPAFNLPNHTTHSLLTLLRRLDTRTTNGTLFATEPNKTAKQLERLAHDLLTSLPIPN